MRLAIVLPFFNVEKYIAESIKSLKDQSYSDFVVYCVNDGSTDHSAEILSSLINDDPRFFLIEQKNQGVSHARNAGLDLIYKRNDINFVAFLDGDDIFSPKLFEQFVSSSGPSLDYCVFGMRRFNKNGDIDDGLYDLKDIQKLDYNGALKHFWSMPDMLAPERVNQTHSKCLCNRFYSFDLIKGHYFDETIRLGEDQDFFMDILPNIKNGLVLPYIGLKYRQRLSSACNSTLKIELERLPDLFYCFKKYLVKELSKECPNKIFIVGAVRHMLISMISCMEDFEWEKYDGKILLKSCRKEILFLLTSTFEYISMNQKRHFLKYFMPRRLFAWYMTRRKHKRKSKNETKKDYFA